MSQILIALSVWLHALSTVVFIGYYLLLSLLFLPVPVENNKAILSEISKRSRRWMYGSLLIFLMLVKHLLILGMTGMGFWFNSILQVGPMMSSNSGAAQAASRFRLYSNLMAISGVLVLLLTALAQVA